MGKVQMLKSLPPRTPEREALAAAIANRNALADEIEAVKAAISNAKLAEYDAEAAHEAAVATVEEAKNSVVRAAVAQQIDGATSPPPVSVQNARAAVQRAQDAVDTAQATTEALKACLVSLTEHDQLTYKQRRVDDAVTAVLRAEALPRVLARFLKARQEYAVARVALAMLHRHDVRCEENFDEPWPRGFDLGRATGPWTAVVAALSTDPDALLPTIESA